MADESSVAGQGEGAPGDAQTGAGADGSPPQEGAGQANEPYLSTFATREDAEKGFADIQRQLNETRSRADKAENVLLEKLADRAAAAEDTQPADTPAARAERRKALVEDLEERGWDGAIDFIENAVSQIQQELSQATGKQAKALEAELKETKKKLARIEADTDPEYAPLRTEVAKLAKQYGLDAEDPKQREALVKIAKERATTTHQPPRDQLPGPSGSDRVTDRGGAEPKMTDAQIAAVRQLHPNLTDEEIVKVAKRLANRKKQQQGGA